MNLYLVHDYLIMSHQASPRGCFIVICIADLVGRVTRDMVEQAVWKGALVWAEEEEGGSPIGGAGTQPALGREPADPTQGPHRAEPPRLTRPGGGAMQNPTAGGSGLLSSSARGRLTMLFAHPSPQAGRAKARAPQGQTREAPAL